MNAFHHYSSPQYVRMMRSLVVSDEFWASPRRPRTADALVPGGMAASIEEGTRDRFRNRLLALENM